eukprot:gene726-5959_t
MPGAERGRGDAAAAAPGPLSPPSAPESDPGGIPARPQPSERYE